MIYPLKNLILVYFIYVMLNVWHSCSYFIGFTVDHSCFLASAQYVSPLLMLLCVSCRPGAVLRHVYRLHGDRCCHLQEPDQEERRENRPAQLQVAEWWEWRFLNSYWWIYTNMLLFLFIYQGLKCPRILCFLQSEPIFIDAHLIPDGTDPNDAKLYFFFRERLTDNSGNTKNIHTMVARVCPVSGLLRMRLHHRCQTQGQRAESGPPHHFMWPLTAWKTRDHLLFKKCKKNIPCFYFEGFKLNGFILWH